MRQYQALTSYLLSRSEPKITLSFDELDSIINTLPDSAKKYPEWWTNKASSQPHAKYWLDAGRRAKPDFVAKQAIFTLVNENQGEVLTTNTSLPLSNTEKKMPTQFHSNGELRLNQILYGPPGTGKTYSVIEEALNILDAAYLNQNRENRAALKVRFDELTQAGHIRFVTFHQNFSYEDFVEGLRAVNGPDGTLRYEVVDGVFKSICEAASTRVTIRSAAPIDLGERKIWKMSLGNTSGDDHYIYDECIDQSYVLLGWGGEIDFTGCTNRDEVRLRFNANNHEVGKDDYAVTAVNTFVSKIKQGDIVVVTDGNFKFRAIGEVTSDYIYAARSDQDDGYRQRRMVKWLRVYNPSLAHDQLMSNQFSQMSIYELKPNSIDMKKLGKLLEMQSRQNARESAIKIGDMVGNNYRVGTVTNEIVLIEKPGGSTVPFTWDLLNTLLEMVKSGVIVIDDIRNKLVFEKKPNTNLEKYLVNGYSNILSPLIETLLKSDAPPELATYQQNQIGSKKVLIIDEINRGNVSRIFGELITLIEPSKREGNAESLEVTLPYSKRQFSVPNNVYLIGTMNTADRSLTGMDIAIRRRFSFIELPPRPDLLSEIIIDEINIGILLETMNERIEVLLDRDHRLGHAYFLSLKSKPTLSELAIIFKQQILPLLQEYFFEDWERIRWVLNDHRKSSKSHCFIVRPTKDILELFGEDTEVQFQDNRWVINEEAFETAKSYLGSIGVSL